MFKPEWKIINWRNRKLRGHKALNTFAICAWIPLLFKAVTAFWATAGDSKSTKPYPVWNNKPCINLQYNDWSPTIFKVTDINNH